MMSPLLHLRAIIFPSLLLFSSAQMAATGGTCTYGFRNQCGWKDMNGNITSVTRYFVTFRTNTEQTSDYDATVTFFSIPEGSDDGDNVVTVGPKQYQSSEDTTVSNNVTYTTFGYYKLGFNLTFGEGSPDACNGKTFGRTGWFYFSETGCFFDKAPPTSGDVSTTSATAAASTTTTIKTDETVAPATTAAVTTSTATVYTNPAGNDFFCGDAPPNISSNCLQHKPCPGGKVESCDVGEGCFKVPQCAGKPMVRRRRH